MYTEFLAATLEAQGRIEEERIAEAFDRLDSDDSGYISKANLREFMGKGVTSKQIDALIKEVDNDKDGKRKIFTGLFIQFKLNPGLTFFNGHLRPTEVSYPEFLAMFRSQASNLVHEIHQIGKLDSSVDSEDSDTLVGLEAKIPGGRYDSNLSSTLVKKFSIDNEGA